MRIISFAWTTPALLAGAKTMTRRDWQPKYAAQFHADDLVSAWDRSPRTGKGREVAYIQLTRDPYLQNTSLMSARDYEREGFHWLTAHGDGATVERIMRSWSKPVAPTLWVVEFRLMRVYA